MAIKFKARRYGLGFDSAILWQEQNHSTMVKFIHLLPVIFNDRIRGCFRIKVLTKVRKFSMEFTPEKVTLLVQFFELLMEADQHVKAEEKLRQELVFVLYLILDLRKK